MNTMTLKAYLSKNSIKPADFARKIKVTERSVYNYINGKFPKRAVEKKIKSITKGIVSF